MGNSPIPKSPNLEREAEDRARAFLAEKKWRKARDELKPLAKLNRARYLPLLIQANLGLAREMMAHGQTSEAQQVMSNLATIATTEQLRIAEAELLARVAPSQNLLENWLKTLSNENGSLGEIDRIRAADQAVLLFQEPSSPDAAGGALQTSLAAIQAGLQALSMSEWERLPGLLRAVPHRSPFAHWALFIKGAASLYQGELAKARRLLQSLPAQSVPAKAARGYLLLAEGARPENKKDLDAAVEVAMRLLDSPGAGPILMRASREWEERRFAASYRTMREGLAEFPSQELDWKGSVSEFYFNASDSMSSRDRDNYCDFMEGWVDSGKVRSGVEELLAARMLALESEAPERWERYLFLHEKLAKPNPRFASVLYTRLGREIKASENGFDPDDVDPVRAGQAEKHLKKAIALDPENLEAHLALAALYRLTDDDRARNRLLDDMVERFPNEKRVLAEAGFQCIRRNAFHKSLDYLLKARALDRLDPTIAEMLVEARRKLARQAFEQDNPGKARNQLSAMEELLTDRADDSRRSRWIQRIWYSLMEKRWGDPGQAEALLAEARQLSPFPAAFLFGAHLIQRLSGFDQTGEATFWPEFARVADANLQPAQLNFLVRMTKNWVEHGEGHQFETEEKFLRRLVRTVFRQPAPREEARALVELSLKDPAWKPELEWVTAAVLKNDRLDPLFRLFRIQLKGPGRFPDRGMRHELEQILEEATRRNDDSTVRRARQLLTKLEAPPPIPAFEEDEEDGEDPEPDRSESWSTGDLSEEQDKHERMMALLDFIASLPDSELKKIRRSRPHNISAEEFDALVKAAKSGVRPSFVPSQPPDSPSETPQQPPKMPGSPDPQQLDLF